MDNIAKFLVRFTILFVTLYFIITYVLAQFFGVSYFNDFYVVLLELCLCVFCTVQGNYHCKYMRYLAWGSFSSDTLTRADNSLDFLSVDAHNLIPLAIIVISVITTLILAVRHFIRTTKVKNNKHKYGYYELRR